MRPPFFAFYPADFANDLLVEAMSTLQVGAYMLLLCKAWQGDPPASLPNSDQILARYARVDAAVWAEIKAGVLVAFHAGADGRLHSKRLRQEWDKANATIKAKKEAGRKGGRSTQLRLAHPAPPEKSQALLEHSLKHRSSAAQAIQTQIQNQSLPSEDDRPPDPPPGGEAVGRSDEAPDTIPFDPLRAEQDARKLFERRWAEAGLRKFSRLDRSLWSLLFSLLADPWWAANYPAALAKAGTIPFLRDGAGRRKGGMDVSEFLRDPDLCRKVLDGVYDPHAAPPAAGGPVNPKFAAVLARDAERQKRKANRPQEGAA